MKFPHADLTHLDITPRISLESLVTWLALFEELREKDPAIAAAYPSAPGIILVAERGVMWQFMTDDEEVQHSIGLLRERLANVGQQ